MRLERSNSIVSESSRHTSAAKPQVPPQPKKESATSYMTREEAVKEIDGFRQQITKLEVQLEQSKLLLLEQKINHE